MQGDKTFIVCRYGELSTKGKNRKQFVSQLRHNLKNQLKKYGGCSVEADYNRLIVDVDINHSFLDKIIDTVKHTFGISRFSIGKVINKDIDVLSNHILSLLDSETRTFKVIVKRRDKTFFDSSDSLVRYIAGIVLKNSDWKVDVKCPERIINVEINQNNTIYVLGNDIEGAKGYPVGVQGNGLMLLSGGIDSPVAAYLAMKRGLRIETIHFASMPYTSQMALDKVFDLAKLLAKFQGQVNVIVVDFTKVQLAIYDAVPESYAITVMRRFMMRIAERIADSRGCSCLISGESLGQVASQTIDSIQVIQSVLNKVMLRPLIGFDKNEIIDIARKINTYKVSTLPFEDCCTVFVPQNPTTKPKMDKVTRMEEKLNIDELVDYGFNNVKIYSFFDDLEENDDLL